MIKYEGLDYDLNSLFEFHVLKKLLEALFKKQKIYDIVLYGQGFDNIKLNNNNHDNNDINSKNIASLGLLKEFVESQNKLKENEKMMIELKERIDNLEDFVNTSKNKSKNSLKKTMGTNIENKGLEINNIFNNESIPSYRFIYPVNTVSTTDTSEINSTLLASLFPTTKWYLYDGYYYRKS